MDHHSVGMTGPSLYTEITPKIQQQPEQAATLDYTKVYDSRAQAAFLEYSSQAIKLFTEETRKMNNTFKATERRKRKPGKPAMERNQYIRETQAKIKSVREEAALSMVIKEKTKLQQ